ncbi:unnamed protein product [Urochloa humidicola]
MASLTPLRRFMGRARRLERETASGSRQSKFTALKSPPLPSLCFPQSFSGHPQATAEPDSRTLGATATSPPATAPWPLVGRFRIPGGGDFVVAAGPEPRKMAAAVIPSSWEELPADLLGQVVKRLPSLADRVRLRVVCRPWRAGAAARRHPRLPPPHPWFALRDGTLVDLHGAPVRCGPILRPGVDFCYLAVDNMAFLVHHDGGCSLMNPLSGLKLPLPTLGPAVRRAIESSDVYGYSCIRKGHVKVKILSSPVNPTLDPHLATIITEGYSVAITPFKDHGALSISMRTDRRLEPLTRISDIAFFQQELYALTGTEGLHIMKLDGCGLSEPKFSQAFHPCIPDDPKQQAIYHCFEPNRLWIDPRDMPPGYLVLRYLVESDGRLLMVRRWMSFPRRARLGDHDRTIRFEVFEANLATIPGQWMKVENLGGQALFLGLQCSKSVLGSQFAGGVSEDCIYFMHRTFDHPYREGTLGHSMDPLADSGVYNMRNGEITPFVPEAVMAELRDKRQFLTWFFPADE